MKRADKEKEPSGEKIPNGHEFEKLHLLFLDDWEIARNTLAKFAFKIFKRWKVKVNWTAQNNTYWLKQKEAPTIIDVIAHCQDDIVIAIDIFTNLEKDGIKSLLKSIKNIKQYRSDYKNKKIYGGVAFIEDANDSVVEYAYKKGLFVIKVTPKNAKIMNDKNFTPKIY